MNELWPKIDEDWGDAASDFVGEVVKLRNGLEEQVYGGDKSASIHLAALASVQDGRLEQVMNAAEAAGDKGLQRAAMLTAKERGLRGVVDRFIEADPERKAAFEKLRGVPEVERLEGIAKGYKPPPARPESLAPSAEARDKAVLSGQRKEQSRSRFFQRS